MTQRISWKYPPLAKLEALENRPHTWEKGSIAADQCELREISRTSTTSAWNASLRRLWRLHDRCNYRAKNTVLMNYLPDAKNYGAEIFTGISVRYIERQDSRCLVHYQIVETAKKISTPPQVHQRRYCCAGRRHAGLHRDLLRSKARGLSTSDRSGSISRETATTGIGLQPTRKSMGRLRRSPPEESEARWTNATGVIDMREQPSWKTQWS